MKKLLREYTFAELTDDPDDPDPDPQISFWMSLQRQWLRTDYAKELRKTYGWDRPFRIHSQVTMRDFQRRPYPNWHRWMMNPYPPALPRQVDET